MKRFNSIAPVTVQLQDEFFGSIIYADEVHGIPLVR
jgi:hypothetical protein